MKKVNIFAADRSSLKLHLGCGAVYLNDFVNIDFFDSDKPDTSRGCEKMHADMLLDIRQLQAHVDACSVDRVLMVHVLEHFTRWSGLALLSDIYQVLKPGGILEMEHPDLDACIAFYLQDKRTMTTPIGNLNIGFTQFYGNQWDELDYETHRYVWTKRELDAVARGIGFDVVELNNNAIYHVKGRDMRAVLIKPNNQQTLLNVH